MFLEDELLQIGRNTELTEKGIYDGVNSMIKACFANMGKIIGNKPDSQSIIANFKRVNNIWIKVSNTLINEERGFVKPDGFKLFINSKEEFKGILT